MKNFVSALTVNVFEGFYMWKILDCFRAIFPILERDKVDYQILGL